MAAEWRVYIRPMVKSQPTPLAPAPRSEDGHPGVRRREHYCVSETYSVGLWPAILLFEDHARRNRRLANAEYRPFIFGMFLSAAMTAQNSAEGMK
jgi:hypothetical protein